jgi:hypothetical protein
MQNLKQFIVKDTFLIKEKKYKKYESHYVSNN